MALLYLFLNLCRQLSQKHLSVHLLIGSLSGSLGSLSLWVELQSWWYFSLIHGTIWGALVGFGVWKATREDSLWADTAVFQGPVPRDLSQRHDDDLHGPS